MAQSLDRELSDLISSHPQVQAAKKAVGAADEGITAAESGFLPTVRLSSNTGPEYIDSPARRRSNADEPWLRNQGGASLTVTQNLFDGFGTTGRVDAAKATKGVSESTFKSARQNALLEGITAYLDVLRQTSLVSLGRDNEKNVQTQLNLEDERVRRGSGVAVDVLQAKQRLQVAKERRVAYDGGLRQAIARYTQVFGHPPMLTNMAEPQPPVELIPKQLDEVVDIAASENPSVQSAAKNIDLTEQQTAIAEAGYYPSIDLVGKGSLDDDKNGEPGIRREYSVLLQANWELFSGFKTQAAVAQASLNHAASKDTHTQANRKAMEAARLAWSQMETARDRMGLLENAVTLAESVWDARKKMREAGKATVMDVLDAESAIYSAKINYIGASYDMRLAAYQLLHAMGRLELDNATRVAANSAPTIEPPAPSAAPVVPVQGGSGKAPEPR